jgi:hypothetical protein
VRAVSRCYKQTVELVQLSEMNGLVVVRQSPASKDVNTEAEKATALEAVTRQRLMKTAD